jgi:hypothetical protein
MPNTWRCGHGVTWVYNDSLAINPALQLAFEHDLGLLSTTCVVVVRHAETRLIVKIANVQTRVTEVSTSYCVPWAARVTICRFLIRSSNNQFYLALSVVKTILCHPEHMYTIDQFKFILNAELRSREK